MPITYLRQLSGRERSLEANRRLACFLAFVAGAANAGGFLAVHQYTSHMSGIISAMADSLALGSIGLLLDGLGALLSFMAGAACSAVLIHWGRREHLHSEYALPLLLEAFLLLVFGLLGGNLERLEWLFVPATVMVLCFIMGLQNAMVTKVSKAEIRTTHVTGMITDIGIELGKLFYWNLGLADDAGPAVRADRRKLRVLGTLVGLFFLGGVSGALGFHRFGFIATLPLAGLLLILAAVPVFDDVRLRVWRRDLPARLQARLKRWAAAAGADVHALWLAARDPGTPRPVRWLARAVSGYALSPLGVVPAAVPVLGPLHGLVLVPLAILAVRRLVPAAVLEAQRRAADAAGPAPVCWPAALFVLGLWGLGVVALVRWLTPAAASLR